MSSVEFTSHADEVKQAKDQAVSMALEKIGLIAERYAKGYAPVDTGRLRSSISHETDSDSAYIGTNVEYAQYQEFGTSRQKGTPFLRPAVENHLDEYKKIAENELKH